MEFFYFAARRQKILDFRRGVFGRFQRNLSTQGTSKNCLDFGVHVEA